MKKDILHLLNNYTEPVRDPLWKHIYLSPALKKIIQTPEFLRLGGIKQLGPASLVYPGAVHTRFSHSLGAFYLTRQILFSLFKAPGEAFLYEEGVKTLLCAALLHDIGHFPHAHALEEFDVLSHETLSGRIIRDSSITRILSEEVGVSPENVAAVIDHDIPVDNKEIRFARNILSGVLDPDKLDYLNRDAYFCGVPYGVQDTDFVISQMLLHGEGIAVTKKGVTAIENILFSKYLMYRTVYWHRTVRLITALIKKAVYFGLQNGTIQADLLYGMDDISFIKEFSRTDPDYFSLIEKAGRPSLYRVVHEIDFDGSNPQHRDLLKAANRNALEYKIAAEITKRYGMDCPFLDTVVDTPHLVSFEVDLPVVTRKGEVPFPEAGSVFTRPVVRGFTRTLHKIRFILPGKIDDEMQRKPDLAGFFNDLLSASI